MSKKVCISGYYGFDNFGDETILEILISNLKKMDCNPDITVFSSNPDKTSDNYNVKSCQTFDIKRVIKELSKTDCLISGGGSLLQDSTSKKSLIYYLFVLFIAQFFRKKTIIFAQGIGPIKDKLLKNLTFSILKKADYITVRDKNSLNLLKDNGINAVLCADPVWSLEKINQPKTNSVGIQLRQFANINDKFLFELAKAVNKYFSDKEIILLSLQNKLDLDISKDFEQKLLEINPQIKVKVLENTSNKMLTEEIARLESLIAMRYHANLIAIKNGVKILPVAYDIKVKTLAEEFNLDYINPENSKETNEKTAKFQQSNITYDEEKIKTLQYNFTELEKFI